MQDLNKCPSCGSVLVAHELVHAVDGKLWCSRACFVRHKAEELMLNAYEIAREHYVSEAEIVRAEDVLSEDLQEVQIAVTYYKTIKLPRTLSEDKMKEVAEKLWADGKVYAEPDDCDDFSFECALVKNENSGHVEEA